MFKKEKRCERKNRGRIWCQCWSLCNNIVPRVKGVEKQQLLLILVKRTKKKENQMFVLDWGWIAGDAIKRHPLLRCTKRCTYRAHMLATRPLPCCFLSLSFFILTYFICLFPLPFWYCWYFNFAPHSPFSIPFVLAIRGASPLMWYTKQQHKQDQAISITILIAT